VPALRPSMKPAALRGRIRRITPPAVFRGSSKLTRAPHQLQRRGGPDLGHFKPVSRRFL
jgi:hypothetical protein